MLYKSSIREARRNPEMNPHIGAWDYVEKYKNDPDVYISFTEIDKIGINPQSKYNTPVGIYTYPLKEFVERYIFGSISAVDEYNKLYVKVTVGSFAPFAGNAKYINFIRLKDKAHFINDMYKDYGSDKYDRDIKILESKYAENIAEEIDSISRRVMFNALDIYFKGVGTIYSKVDFDFILMHIRQSTNNTLAYDRAMKLATIIYEERDDITSASLKEIMDEFFDKSFKNLVMEWKSEARVSNPINYMWNITRELAKKLSNNEKQASTKWNLILSKDLGYSGFADKSGKGYIHPSEPMQAVFFNTRAFEVITRVENIPVKKKERDVKSEIIKSLMKVAEIGIEHIDDFMEDLIFSKVDNSITYKGNFSIQDKNIKAMPYKIEAVVGDFSANRTNIVSLVNFPDRVYGDVILLSTPKLEGLEGLPKDIEGNLYLDKYLFDEYGEIKIRKMSKIDGEIISQ